MTDEVIKVYSGEFYKWDKKIDESKVLEKGYIYVSESGKNEFTIRDRIDMVVIFKDFLGDGNSYSANYGIQQNDIFTKCEIDDVLDYITETTYLECLLKLISKI